MENARFYLHNSGQVPGIHHRAVRELRTERIDKLEEIRGIHRSVAVEVKARVGTAIRIHKQKKSAKLVRPGHVNMAKYRITRIAAGHAGDSCSYFLPEIPAYCLSD